MSIISFLKKFNKSVLLAPKQMVLVIAVWLVMQVLLCIFFGIYDDQEAPVYLNQANNWLNGVSDGSNYFLYGGYISIHILLKLLGLHHKWMYAIQLLIAFVAMLAFMASLAKLFHNKKVVFWASIMYATCVLLHFWVPYLYTDSVYTNLLTIAITSLLYQDKKKVGFVLWTLVFLLPFFRPNGFLFILFLLLYWAVTSIKQHTIKIFVAGIWLCSILWFVHFAFRNGAGIFLPFHNAEANIICGSPSFLKQYINKPYENGMSLLAFFWYNPAMSIRLFSYRLMAVLWMPRDFYSYWHNFAITISLIIYYTLGLFGLIRMPLLIKKQMLLFVAGIALFTAPMVFLCADGENRISLPLIPFILLLAANGLNRIIIFLERVK